MSGASSPTPPRREIDEIATLKQQVRVLFDEQEQERRKRLALSTLVMDLEAQVNGSLARQDEKLAQHDVEIRDAHERCEGLEQREEARAPSVVS